MPFFPEINEIPSQYDWLNTFNLQKISLYKKNIKKSINSFYNLINKFQPKIVLVQGDTTTAAGCAYASSLSGSLIAHNEAGLRTFDNKNPYPEELNRRLISSVSDIHFAPTNLNKNNIIPEYTNLEYICNSLIIIPLKINKLVLGFIILGNKKNKREYSLNNKILLEAIASQIAPFIEKSQKEEVEKESHYIEREYIESLT